MEVNGWRLFQYPLFENQLKKLTEAVEQLSITQPDTYREHPKTKLLGDDSSLHHGNYSSRSQRSRVSARRYIGTRQPALVSRKISSALSPVFSLFHQG